MKFVDMGHTTDYDDTEHTPEHFQHSKGTTELKNYSVLQLSC